MMTMTISSYSDDDGDEERELEGKPSAKGSKTLSTILEKKRNSLLGDLMEDKYGLRPLIINKNKEKVKKG